LSVTYSTATRVKLDPKKIDSLIVYGMRMFDDAGIHVSPSKMSKLVRQSAARWGYALTELVVREYFQSAELLQWESYRRALIGGRRG